MVLKEVDTGPTSGMCMAIVGEAYRHGHGRPTLKLPSFNWKAPGEYIELLIFEMKVMNTPQTRVYELEHEEKVPVMKKQARKGWSAVNTNI